MAANPSRQTTPEAPELQAELARIRDAGCTHVALETSSHALEMHRADGVEFRAAVFTRITTEHLELHGSRDRYLAAKARLLEHVSTRPDGIAVLDAGDPFGFPHLAAIPVATRLTYTDLPDIAADLRAEASSPSHRRSASRRARPGATRRSASASPAASTSATRSRRSQPPAPPARTSSSAVRGLEAAEAVIGRMERIDLGQPFEVVVDYAHTADALETVLHELRQTTSGRLWAVFGSAGERDLEKRPAMGSVAARLADVSVITDEDPRGEDRELILEQIAAGAVAAGGDRGENVFVIPDREEAIGFAVANAAPGDTVLCAGKGHEKTLETADRRDRRGMSARSRPRRSGGGSADRVAARGPGPPRVLVGGGRDLPHPKHARAPARPERRHRRPRPRPRSAATAAGASATSAQSVPPTRSSGSASSQSTGGGAVAREVARSNASRKPSRRPGVLGANRLHRTLADSPSRPGDVDEKPALAPVGVEQGHPKVRPEDRDDDPGHATARSDVDDPGSRCAGAATSSSSSTSTTLRDHICSRGIEVRLRRVDQRVELVEIRVESRVHVAGRQRSHGAEPSARPRAWRVGDGDSIGSPTGLRPCDHAMERWT